MELTVSLHNQIVLLEESEESKPSNLNHPGALDNRQPSLSDVDTSMKQTLAQPSIIDTANIQKVNKNYISKGA